MLNKLRPYIICLSVATASLFLVFGERWLSDLTNPAWFGFVTLWLFAVIMLSAFEIVRHAEYLAIKLGEPLGTLVLTLSVIGIEVAMISAVMLTGSGQPTLARDTMFAVIMIVLNGLVGASLLFGGLRHHEQHHNLQGVNAFLALIVPLAVLGLILPNFTQSTPGPTLSTGQAILISIFSTALYLVFLGIQNLRHREYFIVEEEDAISADESILSMHDVNPAEISIRKHVTLLVLHLIPLVLLAKKIAVPLEYGTRVFGAPNQLAGFIVAILILSPEALSAIRSALTNHLQRSINILFGSVLASIGLTIPSVLLIGLMTDQTIVLGLDAADTVLLTLTLAMSILTFGNNRTNILLGAVHLLVFFSYIMMIFDK